jgi:tetratricopeptide (TPR) repeat protein
MRIGGRAVGGFAPGVRPTIRSGRPQTFSGRDTAVSDIKLRPMRYTPQELEKLIADGVATYAQVKRIADEQNLAQMERLRQDLKRLKYKAPQLKQSLTMRDESLRPFTKLEGGEDVLHLLKPPKPKERTGEEGPQAQKGAFRTLDKESDVYEQMKRRIDELQKGLEPLPKAEKPEEADTGGENLSAEELELLRVGVRISKSQGVGTGGSSQKEISPLDALSDIEISDKAKKVLEPHKTFASYSNDKFNQHIRAAEMYMKEGRYYRAADSFTMASIYNPDDPLAYAGKSHALFAAGDYLSSALFLSRALEIFPEYARFKVDLVAMVGDRDKLESRIANVEEWLKISRAPELQFLLGYVYYQIGRLQRAKQAIDAAYEKLPEAPAVIALKRAIDGAAAGNQLEIQ